MKEMEERRYRPRVIDLQVEEYLQTFGAVCIEGPKWCGKTWTASHHCASRIFLGDPAGNFQNRQLAELAPESILAGASPRLIDEWQEVPRLWDAVRHHVDVTGLRGQFLLTGSATPNHKGILHSGTGRVGTLRMRPMSLYESGDSDGVVSLQELCNGHISPALIGEVELKTLIGLILRGGWPGSIGLSDSQALRIPQEYLKALVNDDVFKMDGVQRDTGKMWRLLRSLARNESTTASNATLIRDVKSVDEEDMDSKTAASYLDIFKRLFIIENLPPFAVPVRSSVRIKQAEKRHFIDPSLPCALLRVNHKRLLEDLNTLGFLFESLCLRDLQIYAESFGARLFHYQDYRGRELDAVVELPNGRWCAFEIKLGAHQIETAAQNLLKIRDEMTSGAGASAAEGRAPQILCVVCGMTHAAYQRPDGVFVVPITSLRP